MFKIALTFAYTTFTPWIFSSVFLAAWYFDHSDFFCALSFAYSCCSVFMLGSLFPLTKLYPLSLKYAFAFSWAIIALLCSCQKRFSALYSLATGGAIRLLLVFIDHHHNTETIIVPHT